MEIECTKCHEVKDEAEFHRSKRKINGRQSSCKVCKAFAHRAKNPPSAKAKETAALWEQRKIECSKCHEVKGEAEFSRAKGNETTGRKSGCKTCMLAYQQSEAGKASNAKYKQTDAGKAADTKYKHGDAGKAATRRYRQGDAGKAATKRYQQGDAGQASLAVRRGTEEGKEMRRQYDAGYKATPEGQQKNKARHAVAYALTTGDMIKPERCEMQNCQEEKVEAHHLRYEPEHWLDVLWLCKKHHVTADKLYPITSHYKPVDWNLNALNA